MEVSKLNPHTKVGTDHPTHRLDGGRNDSVRVAPRGRSRLGQRVYVCVVVGGGVDGECQECTRLAGLPASSQGPSHLVTWALGGMRRCMQAKLEAAGGDHHHVSGK